MTMSYSGYNENFHWWEKPTKEEIGDLDKDYVDKCRANSLLEHMRALEEQQQAIHISNVNCYELYSNRFLAAFDWGTGELTRASLEPVSQTTDNVILEVVNAIQSEVGKARPKIKPVGHGASWAVRQNNRKLDKFLWGEFIRNNIYEEIGKKTLLNAEVCSFGCVKVTCCEYDGKAKTELTNVFPDDILIDQMEVVATKKIWHVIERRVLPVEVVAAEWGIPIEDVKAASMLMPNYVSYRGLGKNYVVVGEGYRVATKDTPGRRFVAIKDIVLEDEEWELEVSPHVFFHFADPLIGFYGQSAVEQILPDQLRLNDINEVIEAAQTLMCVPRIAVQQGSKVNSKQIDNIIGHIITYTGVKPEAMTWPAISAELYAERDTRRRNAFTKMGINQSTAGGSLPQKARLDSAPAVRELNQIQDGRLSDLTQRYEQLYIEIAKMMIKVIKNSGKSPSTVWYSGGKRSRAEVIEWDNIDIDENCYTMTLEAASSFSMTPSAIRDDLEAQFQSGQITQAEYQKQLNSPDPDNETTILSAAADHCDYIQEQLEEGKFVTITPQMDLVSLLKRITLSYLNLARYTDVPVEVFESHIDCLEQVKMWTDKASETPPDQAMAPPAQGMMPPPQLAGQVGQQSMAPNPLAQPVQ